MAEPFLGELRLTSFVFAPKGWALCNGQILPINQNQALFSLLGTTYGGDGRVDFALPNLQGRHPLHVGPGFDLGQTGGATAVTLGQDQIPQDTVTDSPQTTNRQATSTALAHGGIYTTDQDADFPLAVVGGGQAHENMPPYLTLNWIIALQGIFPSPT